MNSDFWDQRYAESGFAYGTEPNDFLQSVYSSIPIGNVLMLGDGEGRNGVFLAEKGFTVHCVDYSRVGLEKASAFATSKQTQIQTIHCDLAGFNIEQSMWDGIASIFCHTPKNVRRALHQKVVKGLKKNGVFVLEAYSPKQIEFNTGGPKDPGMLMPLEEIKSELEGLHFEFAQEAQREVIEGKYHTGKASVIQLIARKV